jgi:uncharacterized protein YndB with AHSA1/START domain
METTSVDRIEKTVLLRAPRSRVWRAIATSEQFGEWFGATLDRAFAEGQTVRGPITHPGYEHLTMEIRASRVISRTLRSARRLSVTEAIHSVRHKHRLTAYSERYGTDTLGMGFEAITCCT